MPWPTATPRIASIAASDSVIVATVRSSLARVGRQP